MEEKQPTLLEKANMSPSQLWANHKVFLICFGLLILVIKFQDVIFRILVNRSNELVDDTKKQSDDLKHVQNQANDEANKLVQHAQDLNNNRPVVDENWHKK